MKRFLFLTFIGMCVVDLLIAQEARINLSKTSIEDTINADETLVVNFTIQNSGGRDLNWTVRRTADPVTFVKADYADWTLAANQDRITQNIWITRQDERGIFNIGRNDSYISNFSPEYTLWSVGNTGDHPLEEYSDWQTTIGDNHRYLFSPMSVYLEDIEEFIELTFHTWTGAGLGGGFSYTRTGLPYWVILPEKAGTTPAGLTANFEFVFDATGLLEGDYLAKLEFESNDPVNPVAEVELILHVTGTPYIFVDNSLITFNNTFVGGTNTMQLEIRNEGSGTLNLSNIESETGIFTSENTNYAVTAGNNLLLDILFKPVGDSAYEDTLFISTNDIDYSLIKIPVTGIGIAAPEMSIVSAPVNITLASGETEKFFVGIENSGISDLLWEVDPYIQNSEVFFEKEDFADMDLEENQDRITSDVWISRDNQRGILNAAAENVYEYDESPLGTLWALGKTKENLGGMYDSWYNALGRPNDGNLLNVVNSMYLERENRYFDVEFLRWTGGGNGGGFSYTRREVAYWIIPPVYSGILSTGLSFEDSVVIDATGLVAGVYHTEVIVSGNDPLNTSDTIPVTLTVTGNPEIALIADTLFFEKTYVGNTDSMIVTVLNPGTNTLQVSSISGTTGVFSANIFTLAPNYEHEMVVYFEPVTAVNVVDTLLITSNSLSDPVLKVPVSGNGAIAPGIETEMADFTDTLEVGDFKTREIIISNAGSDTLDWSIDFYTGDWFEFTLNDYANISLEENQDRIDEELWLTGENGFLINFVYEELGNPGTPTGTQWGVGKSLNRNNLIYSDFNSVLGTIYNFEGDTCSMYYLSKNRYFDFLFPEFMDGYSTMHCTYLRREVPSWLASDKTQGRLASGKSDTITITLDATNQYAGLYQSDILITSNVPGQEPVMSSAGLRVLGEPEINASITGYDFGNVEQGATQSVSFSIQNTGTDSLIISDIGNELPNFRVSATTARIAPGKELEITAFFKPALVQIYDDTLVIASNATLNPVIKIPLTGFGIPGPDFEISQLRINDVLYAGDTKDYTVIISNQGAFDVMWNLEGYPVLFTKADLADWTLPGNYDSISPNVKITRQNTQGLFNLAMEAAYSATAPEGTEWAFGYTSQLETDSYESWVDAVNNNPASMIDSNISMHCIADDLYFDVLFHSYSGGGPGGGFSYTRQGYPAHFSASVEGDTLSDGDSVDLVISFDATKAPVGHYKDSLLITTSDLKDPSVYIVFEMDISSLQLENPLSDVTMNFDAADSILNIQNVFSVAEMDTIAYTVQSSDTNVVKATIGDGSVILDARTGGNEVVTLRAETGRGEVLYDDFNVLVNLNPEVSQTINNMIVNEGFTSVKIDLSDKFTDDSPILVFSAISSNTGTVTVSVVNDSLVISEAGLGTSNITVTADDNIGEPASMSFTCRVNDVPSVVNPVADVNLTEGFASHNIDISNVFADSDNTPDITFANSDNNVVTIALNNNILTISEAGSGVCSVTLTANDHIAAPVTDVFTITVSPVDLINGVSLSQKLNIYPNPSNGMINIITDLPIGSDVVICVKELSGKQLFSIHKVIAGSEFQVDLADLQKGVYIVSLNSENITMNQLLLIE